uniref:Pectate lyase superfamily protein domain-containing protein n=1 Tax=Alexandrium monilatum TaxID=311494 RepID=A0A7S4PZK0_9DINO|mmetsp:Transcript_73521/g.227059  ORF Transcript_73521/g.227059 Transcript_73521/m.227059 type:complete len:625 (-) Transcript_73521:72-1946(-)
MTMRALVVSALLQRAAAYVFCCYQAWGNDDTTGCAGYPNSHKGGLCNTDYGRSCNSDQECPEKPVPRAPPGQWYADLPNVLVFSPGDPTVQGRVNGVFAEMQNAQFGYKRYALLFTSGHYKSLEVPVGYYTSVLGVGRSPRDVVVDHFSSMDAGEGGATQVFWRSVEGLTTTAKTVTYAASQACPIRRSVVQGDLWLSEDGPPHWSSGGFMADVQVNGTVFAGTQQQYFFRNSEFRAFDYSIGGWNFVSAGVHGVPKQSATGKRFEVTTVESVPLVAGKPYLTEADGEWSITVPPWRTTSRGSLAYHEPEKSIAMADVFVAKPGHDAAAINTGCWGKKALLLTPAVYRLSGPIRVDQADFVILGIGFPTLVTTGGMAAMEVTADGVRIAGVLFEAGTPVSSQTTSAMLHWMGNDGLASDIFSRVGAFSGSPAGSCSRTRADVHVQIDGKGVILDNTWFWHADHDDCGGFHPSASDSCYSGNGLRVNGDDVTVYGLAVEHTMENQVEWRGEAGRVYFFQSELPYADEAYGQQERSGYSVDYSVRKHTAYGLGVYIVSAFTPLMVDSAIRAPPSAQITNALAWSNGGSVAQFTHGVICTSPGTSNCIRGNLCGRDACYLHTLEWFV